MDENWLKMNSDKTEFILFGSKPLLDKCITKSLNINKTGIKLADKIKYLGVLLDRQLNLKQITSKCQIKMLNIQCITNIRHLLTQEATETLVLVTVKSHLDYCNGILTGLPDVDISRMQHVQNIAAKMVVLNDTSMKDNNFKNILAKLYWFAICRRIQYNILTLIHKCLSCKAPEYLMKLPIQYPYAERKQGLRSQNQKRRLVEPRTKLKIFAAQSFSYVGPKWWNNLPNALKSIESTEDFKNKLKTFLFKEEYQN